MTRKGTGEKAGINLSESEVIMETSLGKRFPTEMITRAEGLEITGAREAEAILAHPKKE